MFIVISLLGCSRIEPPVQHFSGPVMGTWYNVKLAQIPDNIDLDQIKGQVLDELEAINHLMSTYLKDSELSRFNQIEPGVFFELSPQTLQVLEISREVWQQSSGAFDVTVEPLVNLWGFGSDGNRNQAPPEELIAKAKKNVGFEALVFDHYRVMKNRPVQVDLSAVAKGYAVDRVANLLEQQGITHYMVEVGGEIRVGGAKSEGVPWKIGIEKPLVGTRAVQLAVAITDIAVATSGDYRNYFEQDGVRYSHTINPVTGYPITHNLASVTVLHKSCAFADAYATAFMVMGADKALKLAEKLGLPVYLLVKTDNGFQALHSSHFEKYLVNQAY